MAEWSQLPKDLLQEIQTHLISPIYTVIFRSVCSNWRSAVKSNGHHQPPTFSLFNNTSSHNLPVSLCKRSILLLSPPPTFFPENPNSWIIKIEEINHQSFHLYYPLSKTRINPLPANFPNLIDLSNIRIHELGDEYIMGYTSGSSFRGDGLMYAEKVAFLSCKNGNGYGDDFLLLTIHVSGNLAMFINGSMQWVRLNDYQSAYDDVIAFDGKFYAVDNVGRTVVVSEVDLDESTVSIVANPVCGGDKKRLVEMGGELMLVDVYIGLPPLNDDDDANIIGDLDDFIASRWMWFKVYRLDKRGQKWVEVKDLGKYVLFLGLNSAFSASADDLSWDKGNCICFNFPQDFSSSMLDEDDAVLKYHCGGVFDLENASVSYSRLFWPPPSWITSSF